MRKKNILFLIEIYLNSNVVYFPPLESYYSSRIILAFMNRLHSPAIFQFHYSISFEERNDSLKSITISKRSKIPIIGITIITIIVNKDVSSKRSFFIDILFAYDVAYGTRTRKRERRDQFHSHDPVSPTGTAIFERSFTKKIVQFSYNPGQLLPRRKGEEREDTSVENETLRPYRLSLLREILLEDPVIIHERIASAERSRGRTN